MRPRRPRSWESRDRRGILVRRDSEAFAVTPRVARSIRAGTIVPAGGTARIGRPTQFAGLAYLDWWRPAGLPAGFAPAYAGAGMGTRRKALQLLQLLPVLGAA